MKGKVEKRTEDVKKSRGEKRGKDTRGKEKRRWYKVSDCKQDQIG